jgi:bifunctional non-homologous end joining protein LigD
MKSEKTTLFFTQGSADKVYIAELLEESEGNWVVNFAYGRRGNALQSGSKTISPMAYESAKIIYDKLVASKVAKGYTPEEDGIAFSAPTDEIVTGMLPQLLNPIAEEDFEQLFDDWSFVCLQIKHDGHRRMVSVKPGGSVVAANRRGLQVGLPPNTEMALQSLSERLRVPLVLDCEDMGTHLVVFDVLTMDKDLHEGFSMRAIQLAYLEGEYERLGLNETLLKWEHPKHVMNKTALEQWITAARYAKEEGVVLKDPDAPYSIGRPNSGGPALKYKFVESCTCLVLEQNQGKRSVQLAVITDDGAPLFIGNVTIPANYKIPRRGDYVEIEYLYAYPNGGSLYQPQYKGPRINKTQADEYSSLKFKEN